MRKVFAIFHLNLAYSSIVEDDHRVVIERCYLPLLDLAEKPGCRLGIELTGWTLQRIAELSPAWMARFRHLLASQKVELVGSGYSQLIGPLVPYEVNDWNQQLGLEAYRDLLNIQPQLAMVNEMAFSSGLVGLYRKAGYQGMVMDHDNVALALGLSSEKAALPAFARGADETAQAVLWTDSLLFQKLQQFAHGDIRLEDYLAYLQKRADESCRPLALYANDAEVFDYRPGRYDTESGLHQQGEWQRIGELLDVLMAGGYSLALPSQLLPEDIKGYAAQPAALTSIHQPVPVKKQAKYNVSRWAVSGRDDLWLNTLCHRLYRVLSADPQKRQAHGYWRRLCQLWSSDLRTHIAESRWTKAKDELTCLAAELDVSLDYGAVTARPPEASTVVEPTPSGYDIAYSPDGILMSVRSADLVLQLNLRRGLSIQQLGFRSHRFVPTIGTLPHGYFDSIELGADFYSANCVIDLISERRRITDLEWVTPVVSYGPDGLLIRVEIPTPLGPIVKEIGLNGERLRLKVSFPEWSMPFGTLRLGHMTLMPEAFSGPLALRVVNGGEAEEVFPLDKDCDHSAPASTLVTANTGFGATTGEIVMADEAIGLKFSWDTSVSAPLPMLYHKRSSPSSLTRLLFSMAELDETARPGGLVPDFSLMVEPVRS